MAPLPDPRSMSEASPDPEEMRSFHTLLATLEDGQLTSDLTDAVREIVARLHDTERDQGGSPSGTLTLKLGFKLDGGVIEVKSHHAVTMPKEVRPKSVLWATPNNNLTRRNPRQRDLPFGRPGAPRDVTSGDAGAVRTVT